MTSGGAGGWGGGGGGHLSVQGDSRPDKGPFKDPTKRPRAKSAKNLPSGEKAMVRRGPGHGRGSWRIGKEGEKTGKK